MGFVVSIISHGLWHDNSLELGLKPPYEFTTRESLPFLIYLLPVIPLINVVTSYFTRGYTIKHLQKFFPNSWEQASILNALTAFAIYLIITFSIDGFLDPFIVVYVSCLTSIVGFITYYHTMLPPWELLKSNNVKHYIEALKLEHESVWTFIKFGVELTMIVIPSAVIAWVQILYPMVPKDKQNSLQFFIMQLVVIIQIIYLLIGLWQGILMKLYDFAWGIVRKIAELVCVSEYIFKVENTLFVLNRGRDKIKIN